MKLWRLGGSARMVLQGACTPWHAMLDGMSKEGQFAATRYEDKSPRSAPML